MPEPMIASTMRMARFVRPMAERAVLTDAFAVAAIAHPPMVEAVATPAFTLNPALLGARLRSTDGQKRVLYVSVAPHLPGSIYRCTRMAQAARSFSKLPTAAS